MQFTYMDMIAAVNIMGSLFINTLQGHYAGGVDVSNWLLDSCYAMLHGCFA